MRMRKIGVMVAGTIGSLLLGMNVYAVSYGSVKVDALNGRQEPSVSSSIVKKYDKDDTVKIINQVSKDWYKIEYDNKEAYINNQYIDVYKVKAYITANGVNVRTYPSTDSKVVRQLNKGAYISVHYQVEDWYYISAGDGSFSGFVSKAYVEDALLYMVSQKDMSQVKPVEVAKAEPAQVVNTAKATSQNNKATEVISYAKKFVGNPYRYGGNSLTNGIDCSGFVQQVMKPAGVSLPRSSAAQYSSKGVKVDKNNLQPGDLLFYGYKGKVSHVALYIGDSKVIHANSAKTGIMIGKAFPTTGKPYIGAKRVL